MGENRGCGGGNSLLSMAGAFFVPVNLFSSFFSLFLHILLLKLFMAHGRFVSIETPASGSAGLVRYPPKTVGHFSVSSFFAE